MELKQKIELETKKICEYLNIKSLNDKYLAPFFVARELFYSGYSLLSIRDTMHLDNTVRQLASNIRKLEPIEEEVIPIKRNYTLEAANFLESMQMMTKKEKSEYLGFTVECLKWGEK
jgi:hypothetical protein